MNHKCYIEWLLATTSTAVRSWLGDEVLLASIRDELSETITDRMGTASWGERYARACPSEGASPRDYHLRELRLADGLSILAGIHFYGSKNRFPFVGVTAQSREIAVGELRQVVDHLMGEFAVFGPTCVQLWSAGKAADLAQLGHLHKVIGDCRLVAGHLAEINALPPPAGAPDRAGEVSLEEDLGLDCYESYCEIFDEFFADHPQWIGRLQVESRDLLQECADRGGLRQVLINGEFAGLIASKPDRYRGVPGWLMIDEILSKPFRGHGYAPTMQRKFLGQLDSEVCDLVIGTIDDANHPSYRTAIRCGRVDAGGHYFVYP